MLLGIHLWDAGMMAFIEQPIWSNDAVQLLQWGGAVGGHRFNQTRIQVAYGLCLEFGWLAIRAGSGGAQFLAPCGYVGREVGGFCAGRRLGLCQAALGQS